MSQDAEAWLPRSTEISLSPSLLLPKRVVTAREDMEVHAEVILYILKLSPKSVSLILEQTLVA